MNYSLTSFFQINLSYEIYPNLLLNPKEKKRVIAVYSELIKKYGYDPQSLRWGGKKGKQSLRFEILCQIGDLTNSSLLDVGCGFGDLYGYLKFRKTPVKYLGVDINDTSIKIAEKIYPKIKAEVRDIEEKKLTKKFDWVFSSGMSSDAKNYSSIKNVLRQMFNICKKGVAMNFVGGVVDYKTKELFYSEPEKIYSFTRELSNRVTIRHDYAPYEYTVYIYKDNRKTANQIFKDFLNTSKITFDDTKWHPKNKKSSKTHYVNTS